MGEQHSKSRHVASSVFLLSAAALLAGCDDGSWKSAATRYEKDILKLDRVDEECQVVEGEGLGQKFYVNIIGDSFVRSGLAPLNYTPSGDYPAIVDGPRERVTAHAAAHSMAAAMRSRHEKDAASGVQRAVFSIEDYRAMALTDWGVDRTEYCLSYAVYSDKARDAREIRCTYSYNPTEHTLTISTPKLFDYSTGAQIPFDQPQTGYVARDFGGDWSGTWVSQKSVCRPTSVKLR